MKKEGAHERKVRKHPAHSSTVSACFEKVSDVEGRITAAIRFFFLERKVKHEHCKAV